MKLHFAPNTIAVASGIALFEADVPFEPVQLDFTKSDQTSDAYLKVNPKGRVPALETPHGILTETIAILEFACPNLMPTDPWELAKMREINTYLASTMHVNHAHKMRGHRWADTDSSFADMTAKVPQTMAASCDYIESKMAGPFVMGDTLTIADPYLFAISRWLEGDGVDVAQYPKLSAFIDMMDARPSAQRARAEGFIS